ncbi:MAG: hypothetical protein HY842_17745, partial [Bacteroidetes bacterium]|nr:hypothetical protein [Bacteroidota bacterium]
MERVTYPLLCFQLNEDAVLGILVGTELQVVESSQRKLKSVLTDHLAKIYKKDGDYPLLELKEPALKMIETTLRPTYRMASGAFPLTGKVKVTTPLVYGEGEPGVYECFLPLLDESFYCYDLAQLDSLARHFLTNALDMETPEEIYRLAGYPPPTLDTVILKV